MGAADNDLNLDVFASVSPRSKQLEKICSRLLRLPNDDDDDD